MRRDLLYGNPSCLSILRDLSVLCGETSGAPPARCLPCCIIRFLGHVEKGERQAMARVTPPEEERLWKEMLCLDVAGGAALGVAA